MGNPEFVTFQRFAEKAQADQLISLLEKHNVETLFEDNTSSLDSTFGSQAFESNYAVKLRQADFVKANKVLIEDSIADLSTIDKDYYLFTFTDAELRDVVAHQDEWNTFDFLLSQKLLKERGQEITQDELDTLKQQRIAELSKPEPSQTGTIIIGYIAAFLGGFLAVVIGWYLKSHKKTLPNGQRVYNYSEDDRGHGSRIFYLGIFFFVAWMSLWYFLGATLNGFHHN